MKNKVFLIAEISANHCGNFSLAKKLIKCAYVNGADAVKLQTYTADTMTIKSDKNNFKIKEGLWKGYTLWDLYNKAHTPLKWHKELFKYGKSLGIKVFSTPFDDTAVDFSNYFFYFVHINIYSFVSGVFLVRSLNSSSVSLSNC